MYAEKASHRLSPAPQQDNNRHQVHRLAVTFGHSAPQPSVQPLSVPLREAHRMHNNQIDHTYFTPKQEHQAAKQYRKNAPPLTRLGDRAEKFLGLRQTGQQLATMFNPTTRTGLVNTLSMFTPGAGGHEMGPEMGGFRGEMAMRRLPGQHEFVPYTGDTGSALDRGVVNEGPRTGPGRGMRGIMRRAQGTNRYIQPRGGLSEISRIEALREAQAKLGQTNDKIKDYANRTGLQGKQAETDLRMQQAHEQQMGSDLIPYQVKEADRPVADYQPRSYVNGNIAYKDGNAILLQMLHEMLFGGGVQRFPNG